MFTSCLHKIQQISKNLQISLIALIFFDIFPQNGNAKRAPGH